MGQYYSTIEKCAKELGDDLEALKVIGYEERKKYRERLTTYVKQKIRVTAQENAEFEKDMASFIQDVLHTN